ncbi:MAG: phosphoenolpyruvate--protein phosphotransferase [Hormoscilla sp.]
MVGIVIVSHSAKLAAGLAELARQMVGDTVPMAIAAGMSDPENPLGTDVMAIKEAIASIYSEDGILVLMDLGSAILSAEMALEFLPADQQEKVKLCEAPLVEGTIAAAVQAGTGASLDEVMAEARNALKAKVAQLSGGETVSSDGEPELPLANSPSQEEISSEIHLTIANQMGLHARPAAKLVQTASRFQCQIALQNLTKGSQPVNAKSINQVVTLAVGQGEKIAIAARGNDAEAALKALQQLVENHFGESETALVEKDLPVAGSPQTPLKKGGLEAPPFARGGLGGIPGSTTFDHTLNSQLSSHTISGIPISPGVAIGPAVLYQLPVFQVEVQLAENPESEWEKLRIALDRAAFEIQQIRQETAIPAEATIFDAHLLCLSDPALLEAVHQQIFAEGLTAAAAWQRVIDGIMATYKSLENPYLRERAADLFDVGQRVLGLLTGVSSINIELSEPISAPSILVAQDLTASQIAKLDVTKILGICTVSGSPLSHGAILARSLGIPAVFGVGSQELLQLENGRAIALNGETGQVWIDPEPASIAALEDLRQSQLATRKSLLTAAAKPCYTRDGYQIKVMANIGGVADGKMARKYGADGVGLLRTELLYLDSTEAPREVEQLEIYRAIAKGTAPHPLTIRVFDMGGDKPLPFMSSLDGGWGQNQGDLMLGWRGIRVLLDCPELLKTQLRAILQASYGHQLKILLPMVASLPEMRGVKQILAESKAELRQGGIPFDENIPVGIAIEVPASVAIADRLAAEVDFFSIGTNDLSQYTMAADRNNARVANLADGFQPAVLRMIQQTVKSAQGWGISVAVCGELASEILAVPILLGLGIDELSMNGPMIPQIKAAVGKLKITEAKEIAEAVLQLDTAADVREYVKNCCKI